MDEIHEAVAAHLLYEGPVQIVWAPNAQVQDVHLCSDCIIERIQKPAGVRHLHTMREHQLKPALEPEKKQPPENACTSNQYPVAETKISKILVCMLMSPIYTCKGELPKQVESKDVQAANPVQLRSLYILHPFERGLRGLHALFDRQVTARFLQLISDWKTCYNSRISFPFLDCHTSKILLLNRNKRYRLLSFGCTARHPS
jgi:hypothetical protein